MIDNLRLRRAMTGVTALRSPLGRSLLAVVLTFGVGCGRAPDSTASPRSLRILCGSSMATPVQELGREFSVAQRAAVEYDLGGSETLLPKVLAGVPADIFVCHDPFEQKLKDAGRWAGTVVVGYLEPSVVVRPGNPKTIHRLADLVRPGLKLGIGDPRYSTCGELFVNAIRERGLYEPVMASVVLQGRSHTEIANGVIVGPLDAAVVWNFVAPLYAGKLEQVSLDLVYPATRVTVLGLTGSGHPGLRDAFLAWCREPTVQETFQRHGYVRGDPP